MDKFLKIIFATLICFSLVACENKGKDDAIVDNEVDGAVVVQIIVNPELTLILDSDEIIQEVKCLNTDAEKVCEDLSLQHMPYTEATRLIVEKMNQYGYLDNNNVSINILLPVGYEPESTKWKTSIVDAWKSEIAKYQINCQVECKIELIESTGEESVPTDEYDEVEKDRNGNIIKTVSTDEDGNVFTSYYDIYPICKEMIIDGNDGVKEHQYFNEDGSFKRIVSYLPKITIEKLYNEKGVLQSVVETSDDFSKIQSYHEDGWVKNEKVVYPDRWYENVYQADGVLLSEEFHNGVKYIYDTNGNKIEAYDIDNYGRRTHVFFLPDGRDVVYLFNSDGTVSKTVVTSDGKELSHIPNYTGSQTPTP